MALTARLYIQACIRAASVRGCPAQVARRGFDGAGAVLLKLNRLDGTAQLLRPAWTDGDRRRWLARPPGPEADADEEIAREAARDPDLWVLEIEDREGRHPLDEPVELLA